MQTTESAAAQSLEAAADVLRGADHVAVIAHVNPDADAIGSVLGLTQGLRSLGKDAVGVLSDPVPEYAQFLTGADEIASELPGDGLDLIVSADAADIERIGRLYEDNRERFASIPILNIDHHRTNPLFGALNHVDPHASSTSELMYRLLETMGAPIAPHTATALLFGISGDTGSFQNGATTPGALHTAAQLVALGADHQKVAFQLFESKRFVGARLWGRIISTIELDPIRHIVFGCLSQEMLREEGATVDETEGVAEYLRGVQEATVVVLMKETPEGEMRISMRSRPEVDVSAIATALNGGGHRQAAGCTVPGPSSRARALIIETFDSLNPR
jgi:bifunctional oligoribonuclease and PAP phosphatase NrnA